jgi:peptidoglycan-N-acetylglucosamine deacetylase
MLFRRFFILSYFVFQTTVDASGQAKEKSTHADRAKAIICLTYDDALPSQLDNVIPQLDALNLKGTFFINSIPGSSDQLGHASSSLIRWKAASARGHELGNHTLFHPCPQNLGWEKEVALETYNLDELLAEVQTMHRYLNAITGDKKTRSFAYPCNITTLDGTDYSGALRKLGIVSYARVGGDQHSMITDFKNINPLQVPSWHVMEGTSEDALIAFVESVIQSKGLGVFQFHGVGGPLFEVSAEAHKKLLTFLHENANRVRVLTFSDALREIQ